MTKKLWKWLSGTVHIPLVLHFISMMEYDRPQLQWLFGIRKFVPPLRNKWRQYTPIVGAIGWPNTPFLLGIKPFKSLKIRKHWLIIDGETILVQFNTSLMLLLPLVLLLILLRLLLQLLLSRAWLLLHLLLLPQISSFTDAEARPQIIIIGSLGPSDANCRRCVLLATLFLYWSLQLYVCSQWMTENENELMKL
jgi:hypothetical protein